MSKSFKRSKTRDYEEYDERKYDPEAKRDKFKDRREQKRMQRALKIKNIDDLVRTYD